MSCEFTIISNKRVLKVILEKEKEVDDLSMRYNLTWTISGKKKKKKEQMYSFLPTIFSGKASCNLCLLGH